MATAAEWMEGARPRTLPAAVAPVAVGTGIAVGLAEVSWWRSALALLVAMLLQIGVNYANDYSDGVRGTDAQRVGPVRLVGQGRASAPAVRAAALACLAGAAVVGLLLVASIAQWWLLIVGLACVAAAWLYTGGPRPYGYAGLGEVFVFVFFGIVPVVGTTYVSTLRLEPVAFVAASGVGALACAVLVANNLRDRPNDEQAQKRTLAVRLGDRGTRTLFVMLLGVSAVVPPACVWIGFATSSGPWWGALMAWAAFPLALPPLRAVRGGATGLALIPALAGTGQLLLAYGVLLGGGLAFGSLVAG